LFFYDGWQCVEEYTAAGSRTKRYVFGEGIDEVVKATVPDVNDVDSDMNTSEELDLYYHQNSLGSVAAVTDLNGTVVEEYSYTAYGMLTVDTKVGDTTGVGTATRVAQPFGFTGRRHDYEEGSGLYYYRLRYYDPVAGRFVSRDPLGLWGDPGQRGNGQSYCGGNPVNRVDPMGLYEAKIAMEIFKREYGGYALLWRAQALGITVDWDEDWDTPDNSPFEIDSNLVIHIDAYFNDTAAEALDTALHQAIRIATSNSTPPGVKKVPAKPGLTPITYQQAITPAPDSQLLNLGEFLLDITWGLPNTLVGFAATVVNIALSAVVVPVNNLLGGDMSFPRFVLHGNDIITVEGGLIDVYKEFGKNADLTWGLFGFLTTGSGYKLTPGGVTYIEHMEGHHDQSQLCGPLYLPFVGLPSSLGWDPVEDWADAWGVE